MTEIPSRYNIQKSEQDFADTAVQSINMDVLKKLMKEFFDNSFEALHDNLEEYLQYEQAERLTWFIKNRANGIIEGMLRGEEKTIREYLDIEGYDREKILKAISDCCADEIKDALIEKQAKEIISLRERIEYRNY